MGEPGLCQHTCPHFRGGAPRRWIPDALQHRTFRAWSVRFGACIRDRGGIGLAAGLLSGVAGVGGGIIIVPALVLLAGLDQHTAEGTSLLAILFTAAAETRVNYVKGYVKWIEVVLLAAGGVLMAPIASFIAHQIEPETLGKVFGVWLLLVGVRTYWTSRRRGPTPSETSDESR